LSDGGSFFDNGGKIILNKNIWTFLGANDGYKYYIDKFNHLNDYAFTAYTRVDGGEFTFYKSYSLSPVDTVTPSATYFDQAPYVIWLYSGIDFHFEFSRLDLANVDFLPQP
jgi:hypothetical protein